MSDNTSPPEGENPNDIPDENRTEPTHPAEGSASAGDSGVADDAPSDTADESAPVAANVDLEDTKGISRRRLIGVGAAGVGVAAALGVGGWALVRSRDSDAKPDGVTVTESWADRELLVTAPSGVCAAPLIAAYEKGFFHDAGLNVVLKKTGTDEDTTAAVGSGKYIATNGIFFNFLGPIYNGTPVKLSGGLHHGCLDLYVLNDGSIPSVAALKGKRIGVSNLQGSATNFFSLDLLDAGINSSPAAKQVEWVVIEKDLLPKALQDKKVDAIATEGGYLPIIEGVRDGWARILSNNQNVSHNSSYPCCAVALNNDFVNQDPVTAGKLVRAWSEGSRWVGANLEETAEIESSKNYVPDKPENILPVLQTLTFDPSPRNLKEVLTPGIAKFVKTGFLPASTDANQLADQVFADLGLNF